MTTTWRRWEDEPARWFARFDVFRLIGPTRTIDEAFRRVSGLHRLTGKRPGKSWYEAATRWAWRDRADAWDVVERERIRRLEDTRRFDAREDRLRTIEQMITVATAVIAAADLAELTVTGARELLPMMRLLLRDMLTAQRIELGAQGAPAAVQSDSGGILWFSADELGRARMELEAEGWIELDDE